MNQCSLAYSQTKINVHPNDDEKRMNFTGKERDEETGYGYFGARYMDYNLMTMWLSVDPMADKYPSISPYAYCAWNPVKLVDPDGNDWVENKETGDVTWNKNVTSPSTTPEGYIYRGRDYVRDKIWTQQKVGNKYVSGLIREHYKTNGKMEYKNLTPWIQTAFDEMNKKIIENGANPEVLKYFAHTQLAGTEYAATDKTPWCAAFVNYCLESVSIPGSGYATASSFKNYGDNMGTTPTYGSIAIMNYSHVGFIIGQDNKGRIIILGGNQGEPGGVNLGTNPKENVVRYVYPSSHVPTQLNLPTLSVTNRELDYTNTR